MVDTHSIVTFSQNFKDHPYNKTNYGRLEMKLQILFESKKEFIQLDAEERFSIVIGRHTNGNKPFVTVSPVALASIMEGEVMQALQESGLDYINKRDTHFFTQFNFSE